MTIPQLVTLANPAPGGQVTIINPAQGYAYRLRSIMLTLTSSATVANRFPQIFIDDNNGHDITNVLNGTALQASDSIVLAAFPNAGYSLNFGDFVSYMPLPDIPLAPSWRVLIGALNMQPTDQLSGVTYSFTVE